MQNNAFIPCLSTPAGTCLTTQNWQEAGIQAAAFHLSALLMKPGLEILQSIMDLHAFLACPAHLVLNAHHAMQEKTGAYQLRSIYDGNTICLNPESLYRLIAHLEPDSLLLPVNSAQYYSVYWRHLEDKMQIYLNADEKIETVSQYFLAYKAEQSFAQYLERVQSDSDIKYVSGNFNQEQVKALRQIPRLIIESDQPAADAFEGIAYLSDEHSISILDKAFANQHSILMDSCDCTTCQQKMTRAYLHHILQQTPLLGQRLLIQHNISTVSRI